MMIEGEADFLTEEQMTAAIDLGMAVIRQLCRGLKAFAAR
jgi:polyribonucleotide nucleotidyltransferase